MAEKKKSKILTAFKVTGTLLGIGALGYTINELRKEYDATVKENTMLKEFIDNHDFYKKQPEQTMFTTGMFNIEDHNDILNKFVENIVEEVEKPKSNELPKVRELPEINFVEGVF